MRSSPIGSAPPPPPPVDRGAALTELARRYLTAHGPATPRDLAVWAGIGLGDARQGLRALGPHLVDEGGDLVDLTGRPPDPPLPPPRLLGPFDPLLHGWRDRLPVLGDNRTVVTTNGIFRPILLVAGRAVATWRLASGAVHVAPFEALSATVLPAAQREAAAVGDFLGLGPLRLVVEG